MREKGRLVGGKTRGEGEPTTRCRKPFIMDRRGLECARVANGNVDSRSQGRSGGRAAGASTKP